VANPAQIVAPFPPSAPPIAPALIAAPAASGPLNVGGGGGQTLSCDPNEAKWENESTLTYQWYRNGVPTPSATASTYVVQASDVASPAVFQCAVTGESSEGIKVMVASEPLATSPAPKPSPSDPDPRVLDVYRVYLHEGSGLHLVSVLPEGRPAPTHAAVGTALEKPPKHHFDSVVGAVSEDGSRVFWSAQVNEPSNPPAHNPPIEARPSRLYLRVNPAQPQSALEHGSALGIGKASSGSGTITSLKTTSATPFEAGQTVRGPGIPFGTKILTATASSLTLSANATETVESEQLEAFSQCTEAANACTIPISDKAALFRAANPDATKALYSEGEDLYELDVNKAIAGGVGAATKLAGKVKGLMGESRDLASIYLVSGEDLDGPGPAEPGGFNLYLRKAGAGFTFVAALSGTGWALEPFAFASNIADVLSISPFPVNRSSRVSADGEQAVFMSQSAELAKKVAGYDNTDAVSGEADAEVYLYDAGEEELRCVSCNPSGARPQGRARAGKETWAASSIRGWETQWYPTRLVAEGGKKLFFNSFEALVARDTNGRQDVYEWERSDSKKECEELGAERFSPMSGGCLSMISSGKSSTDAELIDSSADGRDVFFSTDSSLVPQDYGLVDIYDAREGGGFPPPPTPRPPCEGEACQPSPAPPQAPTPASQSFEGQGNVSEATKQHHHKKRHKHKKRKKHKRAQGAKR